MLGHVAISQRRETRQHAVSARLVSIPVSTERTVSTAMVTTTFTTETGVLALSPARRCCCPM